MPEMNNKHALIQSQESRPGFGYQIWMTCSLYKGREKVRSRALQYQEVSTRQETIIIAALLSLSVGSWGNSRSSAHLTASKLEAVSCTVLRILSFVLSSRRCSCRRYVQKNAGHFQDRGHTYFFDQNRSSSEPGPGKSGRSRHCFLRSRKPLFPASVSSAGTFPIPQEAVPHSCKSNKNLGIHRIPHFFLFLSFPPFLHSFLSFFPLSNSCLFGVPIKLFCELDLF